MQVNLRSLIAKLNRETRSAVEAAAGLCLSRTHYDVEVEHFLLKLLDSADCDLAHILRHFGVDRSRLSKDLTKSLDSLKTGNARTPSLSPHLVRMLSEGWTVGSVDLGGSQIRSGYTVLALTGVSELKRQIMDVSRELEKVDGAELYKSFHDIVEGSSEEDHASPEAAAAASVPDGRKVGGKTPHLDQYTVNLTLKAEQGELDPVVAREVEVRQVVDILTRRRQNNPILVGEAGVGKTAVVEGFAMRVVQKDLPEVLQNVRIHSLDLALLQAGAGVKGEFENRLKGLIQEVKSSPTPIILFIDEAHTMIGAGGQAGQGDAANLLKPALARGELRTVAATTWSEYKKYFEKDPALTSRFQVVKVEEPTEPKGIMMLRGVVPSLEKHHGVRILDDAMQAAVRLSHRYLPDRQLPDKAVSVLDTACARLSLGQSSTPGPIEDATRRLDDLQVQSRVLEREEAIGVDHAARREELREEIAATEKELERLKERWEAERQLVTDIRGVQEELEGLAAQATGESGEPEPKANESRKELRVRLSELEEKLQTMQGEHPLVPVCVDGEIVGQVISGWTGIPVGKMLRDDIATVLDLERHLGERLVGQEHALRIMSQRIRTSRAGIEDPDKPVGVFLLVGPSGVGKTETALALSDLLFGGERSLITINMSEFQEAHTVSTLKGSPPGYVGYGEGGVLTEAVRRRPYSVVLLDEIEKAHPDVLELFFQVFDKGRMEDGEGRLIDFKNTIIILTTNAGTDSIMRLTADPETMPSPEGLVKALKPELDKTFKPAFLGRTVIMPYFPLADDVLRLIIGLKLGKVERRLQEVHQAGLALDDSVVEAIAERCTEVESGARNIDNILTNTLLPDVSRLLLQHMVDGTKPSSVRVSIGESGDFEYLVQPQA